MAKTSKDWDERVIDNKDNLRDMIWCHGDVAQHHKLVAEILSLWKRKKVIDVGCGYGRFAKIFNPKNYLGVDFSEEMIKLARKKNPGYKFMVADVHKDTFEPADLAFEVISLGPFGMNEQQFIEKFQNCTSVAMFRPEHFHIYTGFNRIDTEEEREWFDHEFNK
jgi:SAM-dependent methyltransferase